MNPIQPVARAAEPRFYDISVLKFILLWLGTFGFFHFYWFYKQWDYEQDNGAAVSPFWRAVFAPFFVYKLFRRVHELCDEHDTTNNWDPGILAALYIIGILSFKLAGHVFWSVGYLTFLPIIPVQMSINELNRRVAPDVPPNTKFQLWQIILLTCTIVAFGLMVIAAISFSRSLPNQ